MLVRASIGTLAEIGVIDLKMTEKPTTAYLVQYSANGCQAQCQFCPQSADSISIKDLLSRVPWPTVRIEDIIQNLQYKNPFQRICFQSILKPGFEEELTEAIRLIRNSRIDTPISVGTTPITGSILAKLRHLNVDYIGVGLDVASERRFNSLKKPFRYEDIWKFIDKSIQIFGSQNVYVHLIFGLGESEIEFARTMEMIYHKGADVALFSFTPIPGTPMQDIPQPDIKRYRQMQIIRTMLSKGYHLRDIIHEGDKIKLKKAAELTRFKESFLTSGCPSCNRPYYNERPSKVYNYPSKKLLWAERKAVREQTKQLYE